MRVWQSVRFKIVFGFFLIIAPMVLFLIYNNLYAMNVVRQQISSHYNNLLSLNVSENDKVLEEYTSYLIRLDHNPDIPIIQALRSGDSDYTLAKIRLMNQFMLDSSGIYNRKDTLFIYDRKEDDMYFVTQDNSTYSDKRDVLLQWSRQHLQSNGLLDEDDTHWISMTVNSGGTGGNYLLRTHDLGLGAFAGVLVRTGSLLRGLEGFDVGDEGGSFLLDSSGEVLTDTASPLMTDPLFRQAIVKQSGSYGIVKQGGRSYLVLVRQAEKANVIYAIVMREDYILQNLPFFQKVLYYWIPLLVAILLSLYLVFLQRIMFKPLVDLIRGMRKLGQGRFDIRLPTDQSSEFAFMSGTFNNMAEQIEKLKIDVYEEQLRVQRAEYKHLQVQINPHFYMNSLNIIYNLAALKDFKSVQKLSLHLADYFRFLMQSHRATVRLEDEIKHIEHYLEIQKVRYVSKLDYEIRVLPQHAGWGLSPLMVQPFVENAVIHGFNKRVPNGMMFTIVIATEEDPEAPDRYLLLTVADDGPGFEPELLANLENGRHAAGTGEQHLGIWNILRRFKMLYGDDGGISFGNAPAGGAVVTIRLPFARLRAIEAEEAEASGEPGEGTGRSA
ncbi:histidine kinase [Cohnella nanjingensis]|uniref:Histidine kinase n=1 Tax=Cohnella nanjingensis TaxID=1387779 RepID=A0A7X0RM95_9BACL|nr:histidine kinase [Cohnella nanjingensis]MBB6670139.1 histidine kinase [Cohnella nanjingensis]